MRDVDAGSELQPFTTRTTVYVPESAGVMGPMSGLCSVETKPFGPVHEYVAPGTCEAVTVTVPPSQTGPLPEMTGTIGGTQGGGERSVTRLPLAFPESSRAVSRKTYRSSTSGVNVGLRAEVEESSEIEPAGRRITSQVQLVAV
jgi:hypothetical protein